MIPPLFFFGGGNSELITKVSLKLREHLPRGPGFADANVAAVRRLEFWSGAPAVVRQESSGSVDPHASIMQDATGTAANKPVSLS